MCDSRPTNIQALAPTLVNPSATEKHRQITKKNYDRNSKNLPPQQILLRTSDEKHWMPTVVVFPHSSIWS